MLCGAAPGRRRGGRARALTLSRSRSNICTRSVCVLGSCTSTYKSSSHLGVSVCFCTLCARPDRPSSLTVDDCESLAHGLQRTLTMVETVARRAGGSAGGCSTP